MRDEHGPVAPPPAWTPPSAPAARVPKPVALRKLASFLAAGKLEHADILTTSMILEKAGRLDEGWMRQADGAEPPVSFLADVDAIWSTYSGGRYGFRAQLALHSSPPARAPAGGYRDFAALAAKLGWVKSQDDTVPRYREFVHRSAGHAGFFPTLRNPQLEHYQSWHDQWTSTVMALHARLRRWGGR